MNHGFIRELNHFILKPNPFILKQNKFILKPNQSGNLSQIILFKKKYKQTVEAQADSQTNNPKSITAIQDLVECGNAKDNKHSQHSCQPPRFEGDIR